MSMLFFAYNILKMVFMGGSFRGTPLLGGSLLNSITVLFDNQLQPVALAINGSINK